MFEWLNRLVRRSAPATGGQGHLTFGATSMGRTVSRTGQLFQRHVWIRPIIAVLLLALFGYGIRVAIERTMKDNLRSQLETLVNIEQSMLETWLKIQESNAESLANDQQVRETVAEIIAAATPIEEIEEGAAATDAPAKPKPSLAALRARLARELGPGMSSHNFVGFMVADKELIIQAASNSELVGKPAIEEHEPMLTRAWEGNVAANPPYASTVTLKDDRGRERTGVPTMFVVAPVRDANLQVVGVLGMRIRPELEFTRLLQLGQMGATGETYAINKKGVLVSQSRFDNDLVLLGVLPDVEGANSILTVSARDPGGNLTTGYRPGVRRSELPLTKAAESAIAGNSAIDLQGYNDYRGVPVVGAWKWMPKYEMGLITEIDHSEAYRPLSILRWTFYSIFALLIASSVAIFFFSLRTASLQREAQKAAIEAKHLGQYRLEERIGSGAMGIVYKGQHAMMRRPTAIKMLNVEKVNESSMQRFEREVQITCQLNHPNTIAIYDYGRTPEGVFYYAMEFLDGIDLQALVDHYGPQPEGRVIRILQQVCGSLYEAHLLGLVHRDIKPANVMLNRRGGEPDVVKVLDFGLVRALDESQQARQSGGITGTPLYMSPEAIQTPDLVDSRSDIYAVGAIGYFLLTGQTVFQAASLVELCQQHIDSVPDTPSQRLGRAVSPELESALLACLEKSRAKRPQTSRELSQLFDRAPTAKSWSVDDADAWWGRHERTQASASSGSTAPTQTEPPPPGNAARTSSSGFDQTIDH